ncbi:hypothetical protein Acr_00g0089900 [Actinidia rufa]|uniref:Uncharacterized protein n=1 Tax=Actinidia rufa TaxID=165716 RepID=A0A7J0DWT5_9ERIC|nr:hypothetical protein Acr_00g0089900 [Actinidia rufa]
MEVYPGEVGELIGEIAIWRISRDLRPNTTDYFSQGQPPYSEYRDGTLGGKSYITDDINQSPSSPLEGSLLGNSSAYTEYLEMDTSSLLKENNIMTLGDLDKLREKYSFPSGFNSGSPERARRFCRLAQERDEWEFFLSMPPGNGIPRVPRSWGHQVLGKIGPGGYFEVSKVLNSKTFHKYFARGRMEISSSGGDNTTSGDEAMSSRISLPTLTKKAGEKKAATKDASLTATSQPPLKGVVIQEKRSREDVHDLATKEGEVEASKGKAAMPPPLPKRTKASMMSNATMVQKILNGVILPADKEKVDQFTTDELVTKSFHALGQAKNQLASLGEEAKKTKAELKAKSEAMAQLEVEVAKLTSKLALAKKLAIEEFKSSDDFKEAVTNSVASYFGEDFDFYKRQLLHQHPNLGIDVASMEMDADLAEEEEAAKAGDKEDNNANPNP